jgi:hypothetical protein
MTKKRAWWPEGEGLPVGYSHHAALDGNGHVVTLGVEGTRPHSRRRIWMARGRDSHHALEIAWQHHEGQPLDDPLDVWRVEDGDWSRNVGMNLNYPYPIAPQW